MNTEIKDGMIISYEKAAIVNDDGTFNFEDKIKYIAPLVDTENDAYYYIRQMYFQKWATRSIPFWLDKRDNMLLIQSTDAAMITVELAGQHFDFSEWYNRLGGNCLEYTSERVVYIIKRINGFLVCTDIYFFDYAINVTSEFADEVSIYKEEPYLKVISLTVPLDTKGYQIGTKQLDNNYSWKKLKE